MPLSPGHVNDLGRWPYIQFASQQHFDAAMARYQRFLERERAEAMMKWFVGGDNIVQP